MRFKKRNVKKRKHFTRDIYNRIKTNSNSEKKILVQTTYTLSLTGAIKLRVRRNALRGIIQGVKNQKTDVIKAPLLYLISKASFCYPTFFIERPIDSCY